MRKPSAYRKGRNLYHYINALVELDRAEANAENLRQRVYGLMLGAIHGQCIRHAMKTYRLALFRQHYARMNVAHYAQKMKT